METALCIEPAAAAQQRFEILAPSFGSDLGPSFIASDNKEKQALGSLQVLIVLSLIDQSIITCEEELSALRRNLSPLTTISHKNVLRIYEIIDGDEGDIVVTEYARGARLSDFLGKVSFSSSDVLSIAKQLCAGLITLAQHDFKPIGISPTNITLTRDGRVKINPLGAHLLETKEVARHSSIPERPFPPGSRESGAPNASDEQYAVGAILTELLKGRKLAQATGGNARRMNFVWRTVCRIVSKEPPHSPELIRIIRRMTAPSPQDRFSSLKEAADALSAVTLSDESPSLINAVVDQWYSRLSTLEQSTLNANLFIVLMVGYLIGVVCFLNLFGTKLVSF